MVGNEEGNGGYLSGPGGSVRLAGVGVWELEEALRGG